MLTCHFELISYSNHINRLDPALSRAGRFDIRIQFTNATPLQAQDLYLHFYPLSDFASTDTEEIESPILEKVSKGITSQMDLETLAERFSKAIFRDGRSDFVGGVKGKSVSMAALQGYLLGLSRRRSNGRLSWKSRGNP
jgi:chaperone BCS1